MRLIWGKTGERRGRNVGEPRAVGRSPTDFLAWAVCGVPLLEAMSPRQEGFSP